MTHATPSTRHAPRVPLALALASLFVMLIAMRAPVRSLGQLSPDAPRAYLEVGERLSATATTPEERTIALQVLAMGMGLADRAGDDALVASLCIALADAEADAQITADLWDLALLHDPSRLNAWGERRTSASRANDEIRNQAAQCVYFARNWDHNEASSRYTQPHVRQLILTTAEAQGLDPARIDQTLTEMISASDDDPCRGRVFLRRTEDGQALRIVCPSHHRPIGAGPDEQTLRDLVTIEMALLAPSVRRATDDDWRSAAYLGRTGAAHDPTIAGMLRHYGVDLARPYWRGGWIAR